MTSEQFSENSLIKQLNEDVNKINNSELSDERRALLLSELLTEDYLKSEAIKMLEGIAQNSQNPALWVNLGKLYLAMGSNEQAEKTYTKAVELAKATKEPVELILAADGLAKILTLQGKKTEAESLLEAAKTELEALGFNVEQLNQARSACSGSCGDCTNPMNGKKGRPIFVSGFGCICYSSVC